MDLEESHFNLLKENVGSPNSPKLNPKKEAKILTFKNKAPAPRDGYQNRLKVLYSSNSANSRPQKKLRHINPTQVKTLDAPDLVDDYYLNLLDWNKSNLLALALRDTVYIWNAGTGETIELMHTEEDDSYVSSVSWTTEGDFLAVGTSGADVQLWDVNKGKKLRSMKGHLSRVSSLAWNNHTLSSGSRDSTIFNHDVRVAQHLTSTFAGHTQEVCGLKWSPDGKQLASGGNDNLLNVWEAGGNGNPKYTFDQHCAAVKALAWCPFQSNLLASGGGAADRCIRFWNTNSGSCVNMIDTQSQVCSILWSKTYRELVTSHGFSKNQLIVWKYPSMVRIGELEGHTSRVLHMAMSPDGVTVASAAGDESLRLWKVFEPPAKSSKAKVVRSNGAQVRRLNSSHMNIR